MEFDNIPLTHTLMAAKQPCNHQVQLWGSGGAGD